MVDQEWEVGGRGFGELRARDQIVCLLVLIDRSGMTCSCAAGRSDFFVMRTGNH